MTNRHARRARVRQLGTTWKGARALKRRLMGEAASESKVAGLAVRLTPAEARKALAEWAARGGKPEGA